MIILTLMAALQISGPDVDVTALPDITVVSQPIDYRLRVQLAGADEASDLVVSADPGMFCGDPRFDETPGPFRQCWLRGHRNEPIVLTAQHTGEFGRDWSVVWTGCEPQPDGRSCSATLASEMEIGATFVRVS